MKKIISEALKTRRLVFGVLAFAVARPAFGWDSSKPTYYSVRGAILGDSRLTVNFDTWGSIEMYSTATVVAKSSNSYSFGIVAPNSYYPQSGHADVSYQMIVTTQGSVGIATANPSGLFTVGNAMLTVLSCGNIGIATTSPSARLTVVGDIATTKWITSGCINPNDPNDIMVPVGAWCVDKYEASIWSSPTGGNQLDDYPCNDNGQDCLAGAAHPIYAKSISGVIPSASITWFQANAACGNSDKELPPNAVWQLAASGTPDPGSTGTAPDCNVSGSGPTTTGAGINCLSTAGAENMIGSLWEWVADWGTAGTGGSASYDTSIAWDDSASGYNDDHIWDVGGYAYTDYNSMGWTQGMIPAIVRGGAWNNGSGAGVFAFASDSAPSRANAGIGFRCGRRR